MATKPNIIFITTEQQRADTINALGASHMITPNMDQLTKGGTSFTKSFVCAATCISSRVAFYTALYPHNTGVFAFNHNTGRLNWTNRLQDSGYNTISVGKTHLKGPNHGFNERVGEWGNKYNPYGNWDGNGIEKCQWLIELEAAGLEPPLAMHEANPEEFFANLAALKWSLPEKWHPDVWVADKAIETIATTDTEQPLYLHIGFMGPHDLYDPPQRILDQYADDDIPMPSVTDEERAGIPQELFKTQEVNKTITDNITNLRGDLATEASIRKMRKHYFGGITLIDEKLGEIFDALKAKGLYDNSIIILTSDHGDHLFDHDLFYKGELYDTILNVPLIIKSPENFKLGNQVDDIVSQMDLAQYILDKAGVESDDLDGVALTATLEQGEKHQRKYVFAEEGATGLRRAPELCSMIRSEEYKMIYFSGNKTGQLFDLKSDPKETINLWHKTDYKDIKAELTGELLDWLYTNTYKHRGLFEAAR